MSWRSSDILFTPCILFPAAVAELIIRHLEADMTREEIEACWRDPSNYKWGGIYYCKADPRVIVARRFKWMGWTVNFARPTAIPIALLLASIVAVPVVLVRAWGAGSGVEFIAGGVAIVVLCVVCAHLSSRTG